MQECTSCPTCGSAASESLHTLHLSDRYTQPETRLSQTNDYHRNWILFEKLLDRKASTYSVDFRLCQRCGLIYFTPRPTASDLEVKYDLVNDLGDTVRREEMRKLVDQRGRRVKSIRRLLQTYLKRNSGRALDVGGADGHCLWEFTPELSCGVVDYEDRELMPGITKLGDSLDELDASDRFDVILCCHTLEHIPDVVSFMQQLESRLSEGGVLYIEVPYGCAGEIFSTQNVLTHLNFFSSGSLGYLFEHVGLHVELCKARPVLSRKRYLPVCHIIGRKDGSRPLSGQYLREAASITRREMRRGMDGRVALANALLVMSQPVQYGVAFTRRLVRMIEAHRPSHA